MQALIQPVSFEGLSWRCGSTMKPKRRVGFCQRWRFRLSWLEKVFGTCCGRVFRVAGVPCRLGPRYEVSLTVVDGQQMLAWKSHQSGFAGRLLVALVCEFFCSSGIPAIGRD